MLDISTFPASILTAIFLGELVLASFIEAEFDGRGDDKWRSSAKLR